MGNLQHKALLYLHVVSDSGKVTLRGSTQSVGFVGMVLFKFFLIMKQDVDSSQNVAFDVDVL